MSKEIMTAIEVLESTQQVPMQAETQVEDVEQSVDGTVYDVPRLVQWNESSALLLLNTYKEYVQEFSSPFTKKKTVWKKIAQIMNDLHGYGVTALQCENKFKSMSVGYKKAIENNKRSVASHRSQVLYKELDDLFRHNPIVHHIGVASSSSGFQFNNHDASDSHAEQLLSSLVKGKGNKRKRMDLPEWVSKVLEGVDRRHKERMDRYDKLITVLDKIANKS